MSEVWLQSNRRAAWLGLLIAGVVMLGGVGMLGLSFVLEPAWLWLLLGTLDLLIGLGIGIALTLFVRQPRIAYADGSVLLYLRHGRPLAVPLEVVEGFLLGQGPTMIRGGHSSESWETSTLVIKLAEKYPEWEQRQVVPSLAGWCHHYVTVRGTWCEPLNVEVVNRLNARLAEVAPRPAMRGGR